jgi:hypothetical protein
MQILENPDLLSNTRPNIGRGNRAVLESNAEQRGGGGGGCCWLYGTPFPSILLGHVLMDMQWSMWLTSAQFNNSDLCPRLQLHRSHRASHLRQPSPVQSISNELHLFLLFMQQLPLITLPIIAPLKSIQLRDGTFSPLRFNDLFIYLYVTVYKYFTYWIRWHGHRTFSFYFSEWRCWCHMTMSSPCLSLNLHVHPFETYWLYASPCNRTISKRLRFVVLSDILHLVQFALKSSIL